MRGFCCAKQLWLHSSVWKGGGLLLYLSQCFRLLYYKKFGDGGIQRRFFFAADAQIIVWKVDLIAKKITQRKQLPNIPRAGVAIPVAN